MTVFLAGFDGGGTGTRLRITTLEGTVVGSGRGGSANIATDPLMAWHSLSEAFACASSQIPATAQIWCAAGLAGTESFGARETFLAMRPVGMPNPELVSDAHTSCLGAHGGEAGAIMALGTGSVGFALCDDGQGSMLPRRVGGWGFPQGDEGSGAWIGRCAISAMLQAHDGRIEPDALTDSVRAKLLSEGSEPLSWAIGQRASAFAALAPLVIAAGKDSPHAQAILRDAGAQIDAHIAALLRPPGFDGLGLCMLGGLGDILAERLSPRWKSRLRAPRGDAVDGALQLARRYRTISVEQFDGESS